MRDLIIVGAGGLGRELLSYVQDDNPIFRFKGFLDDRSDLLENFSITPGIIGSPDTYSPSLNQIYLVAIGSPKARERYTKHLRDLNVDFGHMVHPRAFLNKRAEIGKGTIIGPRAGISVDVKIGSFTFIQELTVIAHDVVIGDWCQINSHCTIAGNCRIGNFVTIEPNCVITKGSIIEDGVTVAPGSVVYGRVKKDITVMGNPARRFDFRNDTTS